MKLMDKICKVLAQVVVDSKSHNLVNVSIIYEGLLFFKVGSGMQDYIYWTILWRRTNFHNIWSTVCARNVREYIALFISLLACRRSPLYTEALDFNK